MQNVMKKIGWFLVSMLPVALYFGIQLGCCAVIMFVFSVVEMLNTPVEMEVDSLIIGVTEQYMENIVPILIVCQLASLLVFGLWYYLAWGKKKRPESAEKPKAGKLLLVVLLGVAFQFAVSALLSMVEILIPSALEEYNELMEMAGITEFTMLSLISTVILAPLSEELACRGVVYRLAGKISPNFWVANVVQALAFGILHGNLVQGAYAFVLGLILGLVYRQFQNIWICMLFHAAMNGSSILVAPYYNLFPENLAIPVLIVTMILGGAAAAFFLKGIMKKQPARQL